MDYDKSQLVPRSALANLIAELENIIEPSVVSIASGTTVINAEINKYYNIAGEVGTLGITLPDMSSVTTKIKSVIFNFTTGSTPAVTFTSGSPIDYFASYEIEADASYEIDALWNGSRWIIGAAEIAVTPANVKEQSTSEYEG